MIAFFLPKKAAKTLTEVGEQQIDNSIEREEISKLSNREKT